jgi:hypothetical protein
MPIGMLGHTRGGDAYRSWSHSSRTNDVYRIGTPTRTTCPPTRPRATPNVPHSTPSCTYSSVIAVKAVHSLGSVPLSSALPRPLQVARCAHEGGAKHAK